MLEKITISSEKLAFYYCKSATTWLLLLLPHKKAKYINVTHKHIQQFFIDDAAI